MGRVPEDIGENDRHKGECRVVGELKRENLNQNVDWVEDVFAIEASGHIF
jgi:hypothetical protein